MAVQYLFHLFVLGVEAVEEGCTATDVLGIHPVFTVLLLQEEPGTVLGALHTGVV